MVDLRAALLRDSRGIGTYYLARGNSKSKLLSAEGVALETRYWVLGASFVVI